MLKTETIYPGGNLPKQKYLKRMWRGLAILLLSILIILVIRSCGTTEPVPSQPAFGCEYAEEQAVEPVLETLFDEVYDYIFKLRIDHPDIVMAQCIEESGGFTSKLFVEGHNCLGMKVPGSRPTLAVGTMLGHARFNSWRECIADYAIWQSSFARRLTKDESWVWKRLNLMTSTWRSNVHLNRNRVSSSYCRTLRRTRCIRCRRRRIISPTLSVVWTK